MSARALGVLLVLALTGCRERGLTVLAADLAVPESIDFGLVYAGFARANALELSNRGRVAVDFTLTTAAPFSAPASVRVPGGSTITFDVELLATAAGPATGTLHLAADDLAFDVHLTGVAQPAPNCVPANDCLEAHFEPAAGCVETPIAEGSTCGATDACITDGHCQQGACVGQPVTCDDADACTADACDPSRGCVHPALQCAQPTAACEVAICMPTLGCTVVPAQDGARCGSNDCQQAHVCIAGACELRPAPDGSECGEATTCRAAGHCAVGSCTSPPAFIPAPRWRYTPPSNMNVMRVVVDLHGNTFALVGTNVVYESDGGPPPSYSLWLYSFDSTGHPRFGVNLTSETAGLESGVGLIADPDANVVYLAARTYNYATSTPHRVVVAQARDANSGTLLWERDLHQNIPVLNSSNGEMTLELTRMMLLAPTVLGLAMVEGESLHQAYVLGVSTTSGTRLWQIQRGGHMTAGASANGDVWESSAACWSSDSFVSHISASGQSSPSRLLTTAMLAFDTDRALVRTVPGGSLGWLSSSFAVTPIPLRPERVLAWNAFARIEGPMITLVTESTLTPPTVDRLNSTTGVWEWSAPLGQGGSITGLWLLRDGGTATSLSMADGGTELVTHSGTGAEVERCPYGPAYGTTVTNGMFVTREGRSITAFDVPGREAATSGWTGQDGFAGTGRAR